MKKKIGFLALLLTASVALADPADDIRNAAKKLAEKGNYSWRTTTDFGATAGNFRPGPTEGKTEKDGITYLSLTRGDNTMEAVLKEKKGAIRTQDGWKSISELTAEDGGGQPSPGRFAARMLENFQAPLAEAEDLVSKTKGLKKTADGYAGELTEEGAKHFLTRFRPRGGNAPDASNAKGSVKFWTKDGLLSKYEYNVQGTVNFGGQERDVNRTTTVEIKDVGTTKVNIPEEASKKLS
jgi:hypothetical protein